MAATSGAGGPSEVRLVAARDDPDLERRARGVRRERDARVVLPDEPVRPTRLVADEPAERALALADDEARGAAELLGDPMRDLGQVVQVEAQVVGPGAGLGAPVLDDLEVVGLAGRLRASASASRALPDERLDDLVADGVQRPMLAGRRDDRPPAAGRARLGERDLGEAAVELAGVVAGARRRGTRSP